MTPFLDDMQDTFEAPPPYDPESAYWNADHPDHAAVIEEMKRRMSDDADPGDDDEDEDDEDEDDEDDDEDADDEDDDAESVVPPYDPNSAYWNADHPDHAALIEDMRRLMGETAGPDEQGFADLWDRTRLTQKYGAVDELVPRLEGASVDQDDALTFYRFAEQQDLTPDAVAALVREAWAHEAAGGGVPRDADLAPFKRKMASEFGVAPEVFDRLARWYFSSERGR